MSSSSAIKTATLRAGTYSIASTWQFSAADSGELWISYPGESPVIDGAGVGGIILNNPSNFTFEGLTIQNTSAPSGLYINYGNAVALRWNNFYNCSGACISGNGVVNSIIDSNVIKGQGPGNPPGNTGIAYAAITLWYGSSNNQLTHNLIENCQGGAIAFTAAPGNPPNNNNIIDRNILQNIDSNVVDMSAIYILDRTHSATGNQITNNIINGNGGSTYLSSNNPIPPKGVLLDDLTSNVLVSGNICTSCGQWAWAVHAGDHNTIVNNIFDLSEAGTLLGLYQTLPPGALTDFGMTSNVFQRNIIFFGGGVPSNLYQVNVNSNDALPADSSNLYYATNGQPLPNGAIIVDSAAYYANPEFANPAGGNYSMPPSSPAYMAIGFQPLPTNQGPLAGGPVGSGAPAGSGSGSSSGGGLTGSGNSSNTTVNLTALGGTDWAHWGTTSLTRKSGVTPEIGAWSIVGSVPAFYYTNDPRAVTFTDGTLPGSATVGDGIYIYGQNGLTFSVPASTTAHTLTVLVGGYNSGGTFTASLSDGSAANFVDTTSYVNGQFDRNYTLVYNAASAGQTLTITWICNSAGGNVTLNGAAFN